MNENLYKDIVQILNKAQNSTASHQKCQSLLLNLYKTSDLNEFYVCFERILTIMVNENPKNKNVYAERAIEFITSFCALTEGTMNEPEGKSTFFESILSFLLDIHNLHSDIVRFRVCQFINKLLNNLKGDEISENLCNQIEEAILERLLYDGKSEVRYQAVLGIYRLQNSENIYCKVIPALTLHMNNDPSFKVRKICIEKVLIRREVVAPLVSRTRDVHSDVRLTAFKRLSKLVKALKITERHIVIINGFMDNSQAISDYFNNHFITAWLDEYDKDYLMFLRALWIDFTETHIKESTRVIGLVLRALFKVCPYEDLINVLKIGETRLLAITSLNWILVVYWRFLIEFFRTSDKYEHLLDSILPELVYFASFVNEYITSIVTDYAESQFILNEFFIITQGYDISDTVTRNVLTKLVLNVLHNFDLFPDVVITIFNNLRKTIPNTEDRINCISEIISDILYPAVEDMNTNENEFHISEMKVQIYSWEDKLRSAVQVEDYDLAAELKQKINAMKVKLEDFQKSVATPPPVTKTTDLRSVTKCLNIARALLLSKEVVCLNPTLRTLNEDITSDYLTHGDSIIRSKALECYALCCIVDKKWAETGITVFATCILANTISPTSDISSLIISVKAVSDLFALYGESIMQETEGDDLPSFTTTQIVQSIVDLMDDENIELQECATLGLSNLIRKGRIQSAPLVSRMILKWCNPASDDTEQLRQIIGIMLEELPSIPGSADLLENSVLPTIKTLVRAPKSSPLFEVNHTTVIKFMLSLCSICTENSNLHNNLALKICSEINDKPVQMVNTILSKVLLMLDLKLDSELVDGLFHICDDILENNDNRSIQKNIEKFKVLLNHITNDPEDISPIQEVEVEE